MSCRRLVTHWEPSTLVLGAREPETTLKDPTMRPEGLDPVSRMM